MSLKLVCLVALLLLIRGTYGIGNDHRSEPVGKFDELVSDGCVCFAKLGSRYVCCTDYWRRHDG